MVITECLLNPKYYSSKYSGLSYSVSCNSGFACYSGHIGQTNYPFGLPHVFNCYSEHFDGEGQIHYYKSPLFHKV